MYIVSTNYLTISQYKCTSSGGTGSFLNDDLIKFKKINKRFVATSIFDVDPDPLLFSQHYLTMVGATIGVPILLAPVLCMEGDNASIGELLSTIFFVSGIVTLLQTSLGVRYS